MQKYDVYEYYSVILLLLTRGRLPLLTTAADVSADDKHLSVYYHDETMV